MLPKDNKKDLAQCIKNSREKLQLNNIQRKKGHIHIQNRGLKIKRTYA